MRNEIISYIEMCQREGTSLQRGMNFSLRKGYSVILMSVRANAPYADRYEDDGRTVLVHREMEFCVIEDSESSDLKMSLFRHGVCSRICRLEKRKAGLGGEDEPRPSSRHSVAHPTGYPWRVALQQSPLPFRRVMKRLSHDTAPVKHESSACWREAVRWGIPRWRFLRSCASLSLRFLSAKILPSRPSSLSCGVT